MKNASENNQVIPIIDKRKKQLSKLESLFNFRIRRVKRLKDSLDKASTQVTVFRNQIAQQLIPIEGKMAEKQAVLLKELIKVFDEKKIMKGKNQREKFEELILFLLENLIFEKDQEGLDELYERFAEQTVEEAREEDTQEQKEKFIQLMDMMGIGLSEEDKEILRNQKGDIDEDFVEKITEKLNDDETMENAQRSFFERFGFKERKKTQKQLEKEEEQTKELENISKTVKQVYKELMKELHPDKERDEEKRAEKTALAQEVTEAYRNNDLFTLLSIQLEQIDEADNKKLGDEKINYFNTMLLNQARELEEEKEEIAREANLPPILRENLGKKEFDNLLKRFIKQEKKTFEGRLQNINTQIDKVKNRDKQFIKEFVEENYDMHIADPFSNISFQDIFDEMDFD